MSQFASAYPVAGAMATWSWKSARHGVRREREWGWLASGLVLAMHVGRVSQHQLVVALTSFKVLALLYELSTGTAQVYVMISDIPVNPLTGYALVEEKWWNPTFHMAIVTVIAFFTLTRLTRTNLFWILTFVFNVGFGILAFVVIVLCGTKTWGMPKNLGYPEKGTETFPRNLAWMIFVGLPWKLIPFDSSAQ
jgi:hypothetical protein